jgi:uncharacterized lipoprotein YddW (UPF0748 family)
MKHCLILIFSFAAFPALAAPDQDQARPPAPLREFRGVWVASVANIDWPSRKGLSSALQQEELRAIFAKAAELHLNAVIFQVRPMADALYPSELEPWSEYLTGTLGQAPSPVYDPLELAVREAHARGLELHAWFNPFRARHSSATSDVPASHLIKRWPDLAKRYGTHYWLNPTHPDVQEHSLRVILDVVRRYDIDGVHIDDYFYPYKEKGADGKIIPFPDDDTWTAYQKAGGSLKRDDWRRDAINRFVQRMYTDVKKAKPWVKVGISPFGIWRPGNPTGISGLDAYKELYADSRLWFREGWCDFLAPQLYWPLRQEKQSFPRLLAWWSSQNQKGRQLWPGLFTSRVTGAAKGWPASEIVEQIKLTRAQPGVTGHIHFSMRVLVNNTGGIADALQKVYTEPALVPQLPGNELARPARPMLRWRKHQDRIVLAIGRPADDVRLFVIRLRQEGHWTVRLQPAQVGKETLVPFPSRAERVLVSAVDRIGAMGESAEVTSP